MRDHIANGKPPPSPTKVWPAPQFGTSGVGAQSSPTVNTEGGGLADPVESVREGDYGDRQGHPG